MSPSLLFNFRAGVTRDPKRKNISLPVGGAQFTYAATAGLKGTLSPQTPWVAGMPGFFQGGQGAFGQRFQELVHVRNQVAEVVEAPFHVGALGEDSIEMSLDQYGWTRTSPASLRDDVAHAVDPHVGDS